MVILENGKYIVHIPERGIYQDRNPANGLPWDSEAEAEAWQDAYTTAFDADLLAHREAQATLAEKSKPSAPEPIDVKAIDDITFRRLVLERLGYRVI